MAGGFDEEAVEKDEEFEGVEGGEWAAGEAEEGVKLGMGLDEFIQLPQFEVDAALLFQHALQGFADVVFRFQRLHLPSKLNNASAHLRNPTPIHSHPLLQGKNREVKEMADRTWRVAIKLCSFLHVSYMSFPLMTFFTPHHL